MAQQKKRSGWIDISTSFNESESPAPQKRAKKTLPTESDTVVPNFSTTLFEKPRNISNLSTLLKECNPKKSSELSVSKQKQKEIIDWFASRVQCGKPRVLVISGPSGCGKTVAVRVIAEENDYEVVEWITPVDSLASESLVWASQRDKFLDFLIKTTRYNSLFQTKPRRLLLVKDIPNAYLMKPSYFHESIEHYFQYGRQPLVFVCNDTGTSKTVNNLFPKMITEQFDIDLISVNATTQAAMKNMLKRVSVILNSHANHMMNVTQGNIDEVLSNGIGDARSAVLNLIFNSLKVPNNAMKTDCNGREENLGLLHGIGRVINAKRIPVGDSWKFVHDPDEIAAYFQSQTNVFLGFLHENYINTLSGIEEVDKCADIMSLSDTMTNEWSDMNLAKMNLSFCIRGIMVTNKQPVSGWNPVRKPANITDVKVRRDLSSAEIRCYESIICPKAASSDAANSLNSTIWNSSD